MEPTNSWTVETGGDIFDYPGPGKSPAWMYFGFHKSNDGSLDKNRAVCKICRSYVKNCGNTSNLRAHLSSHHGLVFNAFKTEASPSSNIAQNDQNTEGEFSKITRMFSTSANEQDANEVYKSPDHFNGPHSEQNSRLDSSSKNEVVFDIAASLAQCHTLKYERDAKDNRKSNQTYDDSKQIFDNPSNFKSPVWNYFGFHMSDSGSLDRSETVCKICFVKIKYCNTTNLRNHLTKHHRIQFASESPNSNTDREFFPGGCATACTTSKSFEQVSFHPTVNCIHSQKIASSLSEDKPGDELPRPIFENPVRFKSPVWNYFGFHMSEDGILDKTKAICRLCTGTVKFCGNTTNLRVHLVNHHDINVGNADRGNNRGSGDCSGWSQESNSSFPEIMDSQSESDKTEKYPPCITQQNITNKKVWNNFNFSMADDGNTDKSSAICRICHELVTFDGETSKLLFHLNKHYMGSTCNTQTDKSQSPASHHHDLSLESSPADSLADVTEIEIEETSECAQLYEYPGKTKSVVWKDFGFQMSDDGSLDKSRAVCRMCHKAIKFCGNTTNLQFHLTKHHRKALETPYSQSNIMHMEEMFTNAERQSSELGCDQSTDENNESRSDALRTKQIFEYPGKFKSSVWKDFGFYMSDDGALDKSRAVCRLCLTTVKYCGNTTNLHSHLTKHHGYIAVIGEAVVRRNEHEGNLLNGSQIMPFDINHVQNMNTVIAEYLIGSLSPISIVETPAFKNLMRVTDSSYSVPSSHYFNHILIPETYHATSSKLQIILDNSEALAITTDFWKSLSETYHMTVTAHIVTDSWELEKFVLQTCKLHFEHTSEMIALELQKVAAKWKLRGSPILISGDPTNMKEVGAKLEWLNLSCLGHTINSSAKSGLELAQVVKIVENVRKIVTFFQQEKSAQTVLQEKRTLLKLADNELLQDDKNHWNSTYDMVNRLVEQNVAILAALSEQNLKKESTTCMYDSSFQSQAEEITTVFKPLKTASTIICEQKLPIASMILPILRKLEMMLICMEDDTNLARDTRLTIWENLFQPYKETEIRDFLLITSLLDPRYKDLRFVDPPEREHAKSVLRNITKSMHQTDQEKNQIKAEMIHMNYLDKELPSSSLSSENSEPLVKKIKVEKGLESNEAENSDADDWLADVVSEKDENAKISKTAANVEVERYFSEMQTTVNPLQWWKERQLIYPLLSRIAKKYLCVPVTALPSEWIFSNAQDNVTVQRAVLPTHSVDKMVFLHCNYEKMKQI